VCLCVYVGGQDGMFVISNRKEACLTLIRAKNYVRLQFCSYQICYLNLSSKNIFWWKTRLADFYCLHRHLIM